MTNSKLKDSNIEWLGKIPSNWNLIKGKYLFTLRTTKGNTKQVELLSPTQEYGVIPQKLYEKLTGMRPVKLKSNTDLNQMKSIYKGDFCISLRSFQGGFEYSNYNGIVSPAYQVFYPSKQVNRNYFKYLFKDKSFIQKLNSYTMSLRDGKNIAFSDFGNTYLPFPALDEQNKIADFLDKKVSQIDNLSKNIQQEITDLEEYRNSIIVKAVTKGLNPNVLMKDSGIPWIEKIPQQWNIEPIYLHFYQGKNKNNLGKEKNLLSLSYGKIIRKNINSVGGLLPSSYNTYNIVEAGDIIIRPTDLQNDKRSLRTGLVTEHGIITSAYLDLKPKTKNSSRYYHYLLHAYDIQKVFYNMGNGVRQGLNFSEFSKLKILVPNLKNQLAISDYLDNLNKKISKIILNKKSQLEKLNQYKQSIIYEYVTGKKQVPTEEGVQE